MVETSDSRVSAFDTWKCLNKFWIYGVYQRLRLLIVEFSYRSRRQSVAISFSTATNMTSCFAKWCSEHRPQIQMEFSTEMFYCSFESGQSRSFKGNPSSFSQRIRLNLTLGGHSRIVRKRRKKSLGTHSGWDAGRQCFKGKGEIPIATQNGRYDSLIFNTPSSVQKTSELMWLGGHVLSSVCSQLTSLNLHP